MQRVGRDFLEHQPRVRGNRRRGAVRLDQRTTRRERFVQHDPRAFEVGREDQHVMLGQDRGHLAARHGGAMRDAIGIGGEGLARHTEVADNGQARRAARNPRDRLQRMVDALARDREAQKQEAHRLAGRDRTRRGQIAEQRLVVAVAQDPDFVGDRCPALAPDGFGREFASAQDRVGQFVFVLVARDLIFRHASLDRQEPLRKAARNFLHRGVIGAPIAVCAVQYFDLVTSFGRGEQRFGRGVVAPQGTHLGIARGAPQSPAEGGVSGKVDAPGQPSQTRREGRPLGPFAQPRSPHQRGVQPGMMEPAQLVPNPAADAAGKALEDVGKALGPVVDRSRIPRQSAKLLKSVSGLPAVLGAGMEDGDIARGGHRRGLPDRRGPVTVGYF